MFANLVKSAVFIGSAAALSIAVVPAIAQDPPPETQVRTEGVPPELEEVSKPRHQSHPVVNEHTPKELRLNPRQAGKKCRSGAGTKAEAEKDCAGQLNCPTGTSVNCQYRQNHQDWICSCK